MARRLFLAAVACTAVAGCSLLPASEADDPPQDPPAARTTAPAPETQKPEPSATSKPAAEDPDKPVTLAFAGDIHFWDQLRSRLDDPETALEPIAPALTDADLTVVNLETAIATGGTPEDKNYTFRTPPTALDALQAAGVDIQASGLPEPATGDRKQRMISDFADLRDCTGLEAVPGVP